VRKQHGRDIQVVLNEISLGYAELRPEELVEVRQAYDLFTDLNFECFFVLWELDS
jgi:hypothetical protein